MVQRGEEIGFSGEAREALCIPGKDLGQNLEGDVSRQLAVTCPIHLPHPAGTDKRDDFIGAEAGAGGETHTRGRL